VGGIPLSSLVGHAAQKLAMTIEFLQALRDLEREKEIPVPLLTEIVEAALVSAYRKHFGSTGEIHVEIDWDSAQAAVYTRKLVVEKVEDQHLQISLEQARKLDSEAQIGDCLDIEVTPAEFGRIAAQTAKQVVVQRIRETERKIVYDTYSGRTGDVLAAVVQRRDGRAVYLSVGKTEAILPPSEQMPTDSYRFGERLKVYLLKVEDTARTPGIIVSRSHPGLVRKLFELEVPEIHEGVVELKSVAREAGARTKVAVASRLENVDPVGACVGHRGSRVQAVVDELNGEKIDIVRWSEDPARLLASALSPAKVSEVKLDYDQKAATVVVPDSQLSLAIGKEGQNVRLAARLTGWHIDIRSESRIDQVQAAAISEAAQHAPAEAQQDAAESAPQGSEPSPEGGDEA